jgi:hypothetical protein
MRLLYSVLARVPKSNNPQRKLLGYLIGLLLMFPGHATFRNLSRYTYRSLGVTFAVVSSCGHDSGHIEPRVAQ